MTAASWTDLGFCLPGVGEPQVGEGTRFILIWSRFHDRWCNHIRSGDYMNRRVTPPKRVTLLTLGPPPPWKQALNSAQPSVSRFGYAWLCSRTLLHWRSSGYLRALIGLDSSVHTYTGAGRSNSEVGGSNLVVSEYFLWSLVYNAFLAGILFRNNSTCYRLISIWFYTALIPLGWLTPGTDESLFSSCGSVFILTRITSNWINGSQFSVIRSILLQSIGCSKIETDNCGREGLRKFINKIPGFEVTKCGVACCDSAMCNKADIVKPKPMTESLGVSTSARSVFVVSGIIFTVGLILWIISNFCKVKSLLTRLLLAT